MEPENVIKSAKRRKYARVVASRFKDASVQISGSNQRSKSDKPGKKKSKSRGTKRKMAESGINEASSSKRRAGKDSSLSALQVNEDEQAELVLNLTGGLKLLKRETVTMSWLATSMIRGKKLYIQYNGIGDAIGKEFAWLQSYIGVLARTRIPVSYKTWRDVAADDKEKIWECVTKIFVLPLSKRKEVISSASIKWRNFKAMLTSKYIMPHKHNAEKLENVPDDYRFMNKENWHAFVADRLSAAHLELRHIQIEKRKKNKYNHRLSRSGYRGVRIKMAATMSVEDVEKVSRHEMWIKAREDNQGNFKDVEVEEAVRKIRELQKQEAEGTFKAVGTTDVLSVALGNPEHPGRTRGIGAVKPEKYFKLPLGKKGRKKLDEELASKLAKERAIWEEEMKKRHQEDIMKLELKYEAELKKSEEKLQAQVAWMINEAKIGSKNLTTEHSPANGGATPKSCEGSCSKQGEQGMILGNYEPVKKKLVLQTPSEQQHDLFAFADPAYETSAPLEAEMKTSFIEEKNNSGKVDVSLAVDSIDNIVAKGKIVESTLDPDKQTIHGKLLGKENNRVEVLVPIIGDAKLPIPIKGEIELVIEAVGSIVEWPKNLCVVEGVKDGVPRTQQDSCIGMTNKKSVILSADYEEENLKDLPANLPRSLLKLCTWADDHLRDGKVIHTIFEADLFGRGRKAAIMRMDIEAMVHKKETTANSIVFYISHLHSLLKKEGCHDSILFVDPKDTFAIGTNKNPTDRASDLMERFNMGKDGSIFVIPYNSGSHWTLTVLDLGNKKAYWLDPLKKRLPDPRDPWKGVLDNAVKFYYAQKMPKKKLKIATDWIPLKGSPVQPDGKTCALYIMRYMRDIVSGKMPVINKWLIKSGLRYTDDDIDQVRREWAQHVMSFTSS